MSITVRKMEPEDRAIWAEMRFKLWDDRSVDEHAVDIGRMLENKTCTGYVALMPGDQPIGFAEISIREYANGCAQQPVPFLEGIWIDPERRRHGAGRALIGAITTDLLAQGFHELCSDAEMENTGSHQAHAGWGFSETERVIYFRKPLSSP